jgi:hypothetical protein
VWSHYMAFQRGHQMYHLKGYMEPPLSQKGERAKGKESSCFGLGCELGSQGLGPLFPGLLTISIAIYRYQNCLILSCWTATII